MLTEDLKRLIFNAQNFFTPSGSSRRDVNEHAIEVLLSALDNHTASDAVLYAFAEGYFNVFYLLLDHGHFFPREVYDFGTQKPFKRAGDSRTLSQLPQGVPSHTERIIWAVDSMYLANESVRSEKGAYFSEVVTNIQKLLQDDEARHFIPYTLLLVHLLIRIQHAVISKVYIHSPRTYEKMCALLKVFIKCGGDPYRILASKYQSRQPARALFPLQPMFPDQYRALHKIMAHARATYLLSHPDIINSVLANRQNVAQRVWPESIEVGEFPDLVIPYEKLPMRDHSFSDKQPDIFALFLMVYHAEDCSITTKRNILVFFVENWSLIANAESDTDLRQQVLNIFCQPNVYHQQQNCSQTEKILAFYCSSSFKNVLLPVIMRHLLKNEDGALLIALLNVGLQVVHIEDLLQQLEAKFAPVLTQFEEAKKAIAEGNFKWIKHSITLRTMSGFPMRYLIYLSTQGKSYGDERECAIAGHLSAVYGINPQAEKSRHASAAVVPVDSVGLQPSDLPEHTALLTAFRS